MFGPGFALGSSLCWGVADFLGGITSRRVGLFQFIFSTQLIVALVAGGWVAISSDPVPPVTTLAAAAGAGIGITVAVGAFFQGMVVGEMSVVAPISATGVAVPIVAGIGRGETPNAAQVVGIVAAIAGVILAARTTGERRGAPSTSGLGLALLAALGSGLFLWLMAPASRHGVPWAILFSRGVPAVALAGVVTRRRTSLRPILEPRMAASTISSATLTFCATAMYAFATLHGQLVVVSVLSSLYPAVTVMLAYRVLGERLEGLRRLGIAAVLVGVVLLSA